jgi:predicted amino acid-binding ACT domain protein
MTDTLTIVRAIGYTLQQNGIQIEDVWQVSVDLHNETLTVITNDAAKTKYQLQKEPTTKRPKG